MLPPNHGATGTPRGTAPALPNASPFPHHLAPPPYPLQTQYHLQHPAAAPPSYPSPSSLPNSFTPLPPPTPAPLLSVDTQSQQSGGHEATNVSPPTEPEAPEIITPQQMAQIQNQIRRYKALAKKYTDLKSALQQSPAATSQPLWQPHSLVSGLGSTAAQEGMLGLNVYDIGPASKFVSQSALPVTLPQMLQLRERCFRNSQSPPESAETPHPMLRLLSLQHSLRSKIIGQNFPLLKASLQPFPLPIPLRSQPSPSGAPPPTEIRLLPADQFYRSKKSKRDVKGMEKDLKKRRADRDEVRRSTLSTDIHVSSLSFPLPDASMSHSLASSWSTERSS